VIITWVGAQRIDDGTLQVGAMTAFITYSMMIVMSFLLITIMSILLPRAGVAADRIEEVIHTVSAIQEPEDSQHIAEHTGEVVFDHVSFRYPDADEDVIMDINFVARPGTTTAIIGSTGCGKSSLVHLIPRFYDVSKGRVLVDGVDVRKLPLEELRRCVGFVPQKGVLFSGTIASNLRFGDAEATPEELEWAAEIAQADGFVREKDGGFDSEIAQGGSNVSGGQKQRIALIC
jgi:ATP-binding cassette subfamily B protein